jgi:hypothetical protein
MTDFMIYGDPVSPSCGVCASPPKERGMPCDGPVAMQCIPNGGS